MKAVNLQQPLLFTAHELAQAAKSCTELQWALSAILDSINPKGLSAQMHMLQDIDRLQQTLADLACLTEALANKVEGPDICAEEFAAVLRLDSLRARIFDGADLGASHDAQNNEAITWL